MARKLSKEMFAYLNNFYKTYQKTIAPIFEIYEAERKNKLATLFCVGVLLFFMTLIVVMDFISGNAFSRTDLFAFILFEMIIGIVSCVALILLPFHFNSKFVDKLKHSCMDKLLSVFGNINWYDKTDLISDAQLSASNLFARYNIRHSFDSFSGVYKGVKFEICETEMLHQTGSGKNRRVETIFKGVVMKFKANKNINSNTIIATKGDKKIKNRTCFSAVGMLGLLNVFRCGCSLSSFIIFLLLILLAIVVVILVNRFFQHDEINWQEIKLEDPEFNKKYRAYSGNQVEARYLITPAFMERFKNIQTSFGTDKVKCSFYQDNIMFAISTYKNLFEIGNMWISLDNPKQLEIFFNELSSIFMLVDYFKLSEKTGL